jgi:hypothetical protein
VLFLQVRILCFALVTGHVDTNECTGSVDGWLDVLASGF